MALSGMMHSVQYPGRSVTTYRKPIHYRTGSAKRHGTLRIHAAASSTDRVIVVGGGLAGWATAAALGKVNIPVLLLEQSASLPQTGTAIGLWKNAFRALDALDVADNLRDEFPDNINTVQLCSSRGPLLRQFSFNECEGGPHEFRTVRRSSILLALSPLVPAECVRFDAPVQSIQQGSHGATVTLPDGEQLHGSCVVACDGIRTVVADQLGLADIRYAGYAAYRGTVQFPQGVPHVPRLTTRQIYGAGTRVGFSRCSESLLYWFVCFNASEAPVVESPQQRLSSALSLVRDFRWNVEELIGATDPEDVVRSRIYDRHLTPTSQAGAGYVTLAGDALHASTPNLGQGGCLALEDAIVLARTLAGVWSSSVSPSLLASALRGYERERLARAAPLVQRSYYMGAALQQTFPPVLWAREVVMSKVYNPSKYLLHTTYDCGSLGPVLAPAAAASHAPPARVA